MKTIFHCDDMGATRRITERILDAWRTGLIDGFSVLANGDALGDAVRGLAESPAREARIAVHLNLSEAKAMLPHHALPLLTDPEGNLRLGFGDLLRIWLGSSQTKREALLAQIEKEWQAQIAKVQGLFRPREIRAVDSHIHVHMLPFLFPLAARLAREHGIPEIRISGERFHLSSRISDSLSPEFFVNMLKHGILRFCSWPARKIARKNGLASPQTFVGVLYTGRMSKAAAQAGLAAATRGGASSVELLFHIGRASEAEASRWQGSILAGAGIAAFPLSEKRDAEYHELIRLRKEEGWRPLNS